MGDDPKGGSPFELLLEEVNKSGAKTDFKFNSLLKSNNLRKDMRTSATGQVEIYNQDGSLLSSAVLRNISYSGLSVELHPVEVSEFATVHVMFAGKNVNFGKIEAKVQWIKPVPEHPDQHKQMGLVITESDDVLKSKYSHFVTTISTAKR